MDHGHAMPLDAMGQRTHLPSAAHMENLWRSHSVSKSCPNDEDKVSDVSRSSTCCYTILFFREPSSPGQINVLVLHCGLSLWCRQWSGSKNNKIRLKLLNLEMWGLGSPGPFCWHRFQPVFLRNIIPMKKKHGGNGYMSFSNLVHSALWLLRYMAADCYSS